MGKDERKMMKYIIKYVRMTFSHFDINAHIQMFLFFSSSFFTLQADVKVNLSNFFISPYYLILNDHPFFIIHIYISDIFSKKNIRLIK
jgi:hypothetical protein